MTEPISAKVSSEDYQKVLNAALKKEPEFPRFDRDTLYDYVWEVIGRRIGYGIDCDALTDHVCDAVMKWVPKQGDFWLDEKDGVLYVNEGWKVVTVDGLQ